MSVSPTVSVIVRSRSSAWSRSMQRVPTSSSGVQPSCASQPELTRPNSPPGSITHRSSPERSKMRSKSWRARSMRSYRHGTPPPNRGHARLRQGELEPDAEARFALDAPAGGHLVEQEQPEAATVLVIRRLLAGDPVRAARVAHLHADPVPLHGDARADPAVASHAAVADAVRHDLAGEEAELGEPLVRDLAGELAVEQRAHLRGCRGPAWNTERGHVPQGMDRPRNPHWGYLVSCGAASPPGRTTKVGWTPRLTAPLEAARAAARIDTWP